MDSTVAVVIMCSLLPVIGWLTRCVRRPTCQHRTLSKNLALSQSVSGQRSEKRRSSAPACAYRSRSIRLKIET